MNAFEGAQLLYRSRKLGNFPPPYPNGWWVLAHSGDVKKGEAKPINVLGGQYVLWRGQDGIAHFFDAYCPHLGANMAMGGEVHNNCLKCPFHGWEFDGSGACTSIPYCDTPNVHAKAEVYKIVEQNQIIYYWYDAEKREPWWEPPYFPEIDSSYTFHGRTEHHVLAHIQELPENGADVPHLNAVHSQVRMALTHSWEASWSALSEDHSKEKGKTIPKRAQIVKGKGTGINGSTTPLEGDLSHWTEIKLKESVAFLGMPLRFLDVHVYINQIGPGIVWLRFHTPIGQALVLGAATPFAPMVQRTYHMIFASGTIPRWIAKMMVTTLGKFYEQDVMIWQWKTFPSKPALVKEDAPIRRYRHWFSQFYSEHSTTFDEAVQTYSKGNAALPLDW
uniref:cholesterol 7-desaturase n=1 Tax=Arcella intermedia TaxID=1963864 RepID=A0A6B2L605_9EUKA